MPAFLGQLQLCGAYFVTYASRLGSEACRAVELSVTIPSCAFQPFAGNATSDRSHESPSLPCVETFTEARHRTVRHFVEIGVLYDTTTAYSLRLHARLASSRPMLN